MRSPFTFPDQVLLPALKLTALPSIFPSMMGEGTSLPPVKLTLAPSTVPVRLLPSCLME